MTCKRPLAPVTAQLNHSGLLKATNQAHLRQGHRMKVLIVHWHSLEPDTNSGDLRLYEITRILRDCGHNIAFLLDTIRNRYLDELGVPILMNIATALRSPHTFQLCLLNNKFDLAILSPYSNYLRFAHLIKQTIPNCTLILDTIDLFHVRAQRRALLTGDPKDIEDARQTFEQESLCLIDADCVWAVSETERKMIAPSAKLAAVVPNVHRPVTQIVEYDERAGIVFLGGYSHHPNVDAARFFIADILPRIRAALPTVPVVFAGSNPPEEFTAYGLKYGVHVTGYVPDHRAILNQCRVGIAPLRYGAGMKGKIGEYLACGLPCVTTTIGAEGMNLRDGVDALVTDDPIVFANHVITAYTDNAFWQKLSDNGPRYIQRTLSPAVIKEYVQQSIFQACNNNVRRQHSPTFQAALRVLTASKVCGDKLTDVTRRFFHLAIKGGGSKR